MGVPEAIGISTYHSSAEIFVKIQTIFSKCNHKSEKSFIQAIALC